MTFGSVFLTVFVVVMTVFCAGVALALTRRAVQLYYDRTPPGTEDSDVAARATGETSGDSRGEDADEDGIFRTALAEGPGEAVKQGMAGFLLTRPWGCVLASVLNAAVAVFLALQLPNAWRGDSSTMESAFAPFEMAMSVLEIVWYSSLLVGLVCWVGWAGWRVVAGHKTDWGSPVFFLALFMVAWLYTWAVGGMDGYLDIFR